MEIRLPQDCLCVRMRLFDGNPAGPFSFFDNPKNLLNMKNSPYSMTYSIKLYILIQESVQNINIF